MGQAVAAGQARVGLHLHVGVGQIARKRRADHDARHVKIVRHHVRRKVRHVAQGVGLQLFAVCGLGEARGGLPVVAVAGADARALAHEEIRAQAAVQIGVGKLGEKRGHGGRRQVEIGQHEACGRSVDSRPPGQGLAGREQNKREGKNQKERHD